jgi:hypothetical protein
LERTSCILHALVIIEHSSVNPIFDLVEFI